MDKEMNLTKKIAEIDALLEAGEEAKAEEELRKAITQYAEAEPDNIIGQCVLLNELGGFYRSRGVFDKGEEAYLKAKNLLEEIRCREYIVDGPAPVPGCCVCNPRAYGASCFETGTQTPQSHTEIIYENETMSVNYATTLNNLAGLYRMNKQFQKAIDTFDAAINVYENCGGDVSPDYLASVYNNKGLVYLDIQKTDQAKAMFLNAKKILEKSGDYKFAMGTTISNLGFAFIIENKASEATPLFEEAKKLFEEVGSGDMAQSCETLLIRLRRM